MRSLLIVLLLAGCNKAVKPEAPARVVETKVKVYVNVADDLVKVHPWKRGCKPSESLQCSKERGDVAEEYERQIKAIKKIRGTAVPE